MNLFDKLQACRLAYSALIDHNNDDDKQLAELLLKKEKQLELEMDKSIAKGRNNTIIIIPILLMLVVFFTSCSNNDLQARIVKNGAIVKCFNEPELKLKSGDTVLVAKHGGEWNVLNNGELEDYDDVITVNNTSHGICHRKAIIQ